MPLYVCVVDCEFATEIDNPDLEVLAGEHVYEIEAPDRDQAERDALAQFFGAHPEVERLGDRVDVSVTVRRKAATGVGPAAPRRGRVTAREGPAYG